MKVISRSDPSARRVRSIDITGVMPLPPDTNRRRRGRTRRQHEVPADRVQADDHSGPGVVIQVGGHQAAVVATDRQFDVRVALGIRG